jgi:hypothetical protein
MPEQSRITAYAARRAKLLFGSFRKGEANDPETFVAVIAATLARYPEDVITTVTHFTGLPTQQDFLPTVREVYLACEAVIGPHREAEARRQRTERQLAERAQFDSRAGRLGASDAEATTPLEETIKMAVNRYVHHR